MKHMKLNKAEMANIYGGIDCEFHVEDDQCVKECGACYPGQTVAKEAYKEHTINADRAWGN